MYGDNKRNTNVDKNKLLDISFIKYIAKAIKCKTPKNIILSFGKKIYDVNVIKRQFINI